MILVLQRQSSLKACVSEQSDTVYHVASVLFWHQEKCTLVSHNHMAVLANSPKRENKKQRTMCFHVYSWCSSSEKPWTIWCLVTVAGPLKIQMGPAFDCANQRGRFHVELKEDNSLVSLDDYIQNHWGKDLSLSRAGVFNWPRRACPLISLFFKCFVFLIL